MKIFDATLGRLERALDVRLVRHNALAGNLANVDTPGYRPKDVDFSAAMASAPQEGGVGGTSSTTRTDAGHMNVAVGSGVAGSSDDGIPMIEGAGSSSMLDGNRVDLDRTMAELATNGMQYNAGARVAGKKLAILRYVSSDGNG